MTQNSAILSLWLNDYLPLNKDIFCEIASFCQSAGGASKPDSVGDFGLKDS